MRKLIIPLAVLASMAAFSGLVLPAAAESGEGAGCVVQPSAAPLDLNAIPSKPVSGPMAVTGVGGDDECDDVQVGGTHAGSSDSEGGMGSGGEQGEGDD